MTAKEPSITKLVVSFYKFNSVSLRKTEFIGASSLKIICRVGKRNQYQRILQTKNGRPEDQHTYHNQGVANFWLGRPFIGAS